MAEPKRQSPGLLPSFERSDVVPRIFLSYSRKQKGFVERLNDFLVNAGYYPFFDQHSIPAGVAFPDCIRQAATESNIGVAILSEEYMSSKWPMMELDIFTSGSVEVMPLFYKLSPNDFKSSTKLSEWREKWKALAQEDKMLDISRWEDAVKQLACQAGEVYRSGASEGQYIKKIVTTICTKLPPSVTYDVSYAKGQERIVKEVEARFEDALAARKPSSDTVIIGMHGVGASGKTTACEVIANFYKPHYSGKSTVMEFPSLKDDGAIVKECKRVLKLLTRASKELLGEVHRFDEVVSLIKMRMKREAVFLALDNVCEHSCEEARRILGADFGPGSKVLVTSRSEELLKELLKDCDEACVRPVISLNKDEAIETLQASFGSDLSLTSRKLLDLAVSLCLFNGSYHPPALLELGRKLKKMGGFGDPMAIDRNLARITSNLQGSNIEDSIKINYAGTSRIGQRMFLEESISI